MRERFRATLAAVSGLNASVPCVVYAAKSTDDARGSIATQVVDCRSAIECEGGTLIGEPQIDENRSALQGQPGARPGAGEGHGCGGGARTRRGAAVGAAQ